MYQLHPITNNRSAIIAWALYDWATSAFSIIVTTFIFAAYFSQKIAPNPIIGTRDWGYTVSISALFMLLSPIFGAIADHSGRRKTWLGLFTSLTILGAALLWFAKPSSDHIYTTLTFVIIGTVGLEIGQVFYNALLPHIVTEKYLGRVSGWGWGLGYAGGLVALTICLYGFVEAEPHWLNTSLAENIRICGPFTALWIFIFCLPLFFKVPDYPSSGLTIPQAITQGLGTFFSTLKTLPKQKNLFLFLIARMIYLDGLNTVFAFGGIYAAGTFGMTMTQVIKFGIATNIAAGLGAAGFAWIDDYIGSKKTIMIALIMLLSLGISIVLVKSQLTFWILAVILSLFFGPVQAASRALMARLAPPDQITEMFGLYALSGKVTAFVGPWLMGTVTLLFNSQRVGMASVLSFFVVGAILLAKVRA